MPARASNIKYKSNESVKRDILYTKCKKIQTKYKFKYKMLMFARGSNMKYKSNEILMFVRGKHSVIKIIKAKNKLKKIQIQIVDVCQKNKCKQKQMQIQRVDVCQKKQIQAKIK